MSLNQRLARLERDAGGRPCPVCGGRRIVTVYHNDLIGGKPASDPCPACGREPVNIILFATRPALGEDRADAVAGSAS